MNDEENINKEKIIELLEKNLSDVNYWLTFAEAKNGVMVTLNSAFVGLIISSDKFTINNPIMVFILIMIFIPLIISLVSFIPDTKDYATLNISNNISIDNKNVCFYGHIKDFDNKRYIKLLYKKYFGSDLEDNNIPDIAIDYSSEIIYNSNITIKKLNKFKKALEFEFLIIAILIIFIIIA